MELTKHFNAPTSGAYVPGTDASNVNGTDLMTESTENLRLRAKGLALDKWETANRDELVAALVEYRKTQIKPNEVPN